MKHTSDCVLGLPKAGKARWTGARAAVAAVCACAGLLGAGSALAQDTPAPAAPASATTATELSEGEVVRWDPRTRKLTLRHGPIQNLQMPPMTMVFVVQDTTHLQALQPGTKMRFRAEQQQGAYVLTRLEPAP